MQATGKAGDPAGRANALPRRDKGRRSHAVAALRRQRPQPDKHRRRCLACLQRNARSAPFLVLGQGRLRARSLSAPLDLLEVADLRLEDGVWFSAIVLELHGKALPAPSTRPLDPFAARAVSECRDGPRVRLLSPGWRLNGRNLSLLEAAEVIDLYLDIARAQARLRQLGEIPPSASSSLPTPRIFP
ncbi:hypothetical protein K652_16917 [Pseudomonas aeruginosa VRFPA02]|nr:hypothetical protein K652_16917 [Pseudomonas aeruginosa VRFPA02]